MSFKSWKRILDLCNEGIIIYTDNEVSYTNSGFINITKKYWKNYASTEINVINPLIID